MTLKGVIALILRYFTEFDSFAGRYVTVVEDTVVVSDSRRSQDIPTSRLGLFSRTNVNVSVSSRFREADVSVSSRSRPFTSRTQDQFSAKLCGGQYFTDIMGLS